MATFPLVEPPPSLRKIIYYAFLHDLDHVWKFSSIFSMNPFPYITPIHRCILHRGHRSSFVSTKFLGGQYHKNVQWSQTDAGWHTHRQQPQSATEQCPIVVWLWGHKLLNSTHTLYYSTLSNSLLMVTNRRFCTIFSQ